MVSKSSKFTYCKTKENAAFIKCLNLIFA